MYFQTFSYLIETENSAETSLTTGQLFGYAFLKFFTVFVGSLAIGTAISIITALLFKVCIRAPRTQVHRCRAPLTSQGCTDDADMISVCSFRWDGNNGNCIIFPHVLVFVLISRSAWINWNCFNFILWNSTRHDQN